MVTCCRSVTRLLAVCLPASRKISRLHMYLTKGSWRCLSIYIFFVCSPLHNLTQSSCMEMPRTGLRAMHAAMTQKEKNPRSSSSVFTLKSQMRWISYLHFFKRGIENHKLCKMVAENESLWIPGHFTSPLKQFVRTVCAILALHFIILFFI